MKSLIKLYVCGNSCNVTLWIRNCICHVHTIVWDTATSMNIVCGCNDRVGYEPVHLHLLWVGGNVRLATGTGSATDWVSRLCVALSRAVRTTDRMHTCRCLVPCLVVDVAGLVSPCDDRTSPGRRSCDLVGSPSLACYKTRTGSRVTSSAGSSGRQTSCRLDATCICEFNDVLNVRLEWEFDVVWRRRIISENISENGKGRRWPSVTLLGHAIAVVTASEVVSSRGLIGAHVRLSAIPGMRGV